MDRIWERIHFRHVLSLTLLLLYLDIRYKRVSSRSRDKNLSQRQQELSCASSFLFLGWQNVSKERTRIWDEIVTRARDVFLSLQVCAHKSLESFVFLLSCVELLAEWHEGLHSFLHFLNSSLSTFQRKTNGRERVSPSKSKVWLR